MSTNEPKFMTDMMADMAELSRQIKETKVQLQILAGDWLGVAAVEEPQPTKKKKKKRRKNARSVAALATLRRTAPRPTTSLHTTWTTQKPDLRCRESTI